jgi:predicted N-acetyltransferase YhbS
MSLQSTPIIEPFDHADAQLVAKSEALLDRAFGIGRRTKTSYRFREGESAVSGLSFGLWLPASDAPDGRGDRLLVAIISYWHLRIGIQGHEAIMLGPLAVEPLLQGQGLGRKLMDHTLQLAGELGHRLVILVGDEPYYAASGFARVPDGRLMLPGPVDPARLLYRELQPGSLAPVSGLVLPPGRFAEASSARP